jgi:hypothetical protein
MSDYLKCAKCSTSVVVAKDWTFDKATACSHTNRVFPKGHLLKGRPGVVAVYKGKQRK